MSYPASIIRSGLTCQMISCKAHASFGNCIAGRPSQKNCTHIYVAKPQHTITGKLLQRLIFAQTSNIGLNLFLKLFARDSLQISFQ